MPIYVTIPGLLVVFAAGVWLMRRGIRGRRVGTDPTCAGCDYNLTGLGPTTRCCPECGLGLTDETVTVGRRGRWAIPSVLLGCLMVLPSGVGVVSETWQFVETFDWYHYAPLEQVLADARATSPAGALRQAKGISELQRRLEHGRLSGPEVRGIAKYALQQHASPDTATFSVAWTDLLERLDNLQLLTRDEQHQYLSQLGICRFDVRSRIRQGEPLPYRFSVRSRDECVNKRFTGSALFRIVDSQAVPLHVEIPKGPSIDLDISGSLSTTLYGYTLRSSCGSSRATKKMRPGKYRVTLQIEESLKFKDCLTGGSWHPAAIDTRLMRTAEFEILPSDAPDDMLRVRNAGLAARLEAILYIDEARYSPDSGDGAGPRIGILIGLREALPCGIACRVTAHVGGTTHELGRLVLEKGEGYPNWLIYLEMKVPALVDRQLSVELVADPELARESAHVFGVFDGDVSLGSIEIITDSRD